MSKDSYAALFTKEICTELLPAEKTNDFFEALFGDPEEGSYDIELTYTGSTADTVHFDLLLHERPGRCLACNLTQGLPQVFSRHPVINIGGIVEEVGTIMAGKARTGNWNLGHTRQIKSSLHAIPLSIELQPI